MSQRRKHPSSKKSINPKAKKATQRKISWEKKAGFGLTFAGILLVGIPQFQPLLKPVILSQAHSIQEPIRADYAFQNKNRERDIPVRIVIPSVSINLPITVAPLIGGYWQTSDSSASFGEGSSVPGGGGNTVIFAHAKEGLFLPLKNVRHGDTVYVYTQNKWFSYEINDIKEVTPNDVYVVKPTNDERLTLFTCSGFFDTKRLVVTARPIQW